MDVKTFLVILFSPLILVWWLLVGIVQTFAEGAGVIGAYWRLGQKRKLIAHGDADWASEKLLKAGGHLERKGWLIGKLETKHWYGKRSKLLYTHYEASGLCVSGKGMGKTQTGIAQLKDLATRKDKDDVVIIDPAGDLVATAEVFRANGYDVRMIDFEHPHGSDWHDPMTFLRTDAPENLERDIDQMVELLIVEDEATKEPHFLEFCRVMLAGAIAHMAENDYANLTLHNVATRLTADAQNRHAMFDAMLKSSSPLVQQAVTAYREAGEKERGSFGTTLARKLKPCLRTGIMLVTQSDEMNEGRRIRGWSWEDIYLAEKPTAVFIVTGLGTGEGMAARLILGNAINTRRYVYGSLRRRVETRSKFKRGLRLFVDESKTIGYCHAIMNANDELRKAQVSTMMYWLSSRDIYKTYPDAVTLIENSDLFIFGGSKEKSWMEDVSWLVGEKTIANQGGSQNDNGDTESFNEQARRVIKSDEIRRMGRMDLLYVNSFLARKVLKPYKQHADRVEHIYGS